MRGRFAAATGLIFVVLAAAAFLVGGETPDADASAREAVEYYTENDGQIFMASILLAWAAVFFLFFAGTLRAGLRRAEGDVGAMSTIAFGGAVAAAIGMALFSTVGITVADTADELAPAAVQTLNAMNADFFVPVAVGTAVFLIASGLTITRTGLLPGWLGWVAVVIGVLALSPVGFFAFLAMMAWSLVASLMMISRAGGDTPTAPMPPAA